MNPQRLAAAILLCLATPNSPGESQNMDSELSTLADKLASQIKEQEKKKSCCARFH